MKSTGILSVASTLNLRGRLIDLREPRAMGVLNITPDSFYAGSRQETETAILKKAESMIEEGATFLDVGGYSSRPGAADITTSEETDRVLRAVKPICKSFPEALVSVDTFRSSVASAAINEGACMVNDISGGMDRDMFETVARLKVPYVLMHMRGTPETMRDLNQYDDIIKDLLDYFHAKIGTLKEAGVSDIIIDPGFGFAKDREQNFTLLNSLETFQITGKPLLVGLSRKSMIWKTLSVEPGEALNGTTALNTVALLKGAAILRVHDVKEAMQVIRLVNHLHGKNK